MNSAYSLFLTGIIAYGSVLGGMACCASITPRIFATLSTMLILISQKTSILTINSWKTQFRRQSGHVRVKESVF